MATLIAVLVTLFLCMLFGLCLYIRWRFRWHEYARDGGQALISFLQVMTEEKKQSMKEKKEKEDR